MIMNYGLINPILCSLHCAYFQALIVTGVKSSSPGMDPSLQIGSSVCIAHIASCLASSASCHGNMLARKDFHSNALEA